jgi:hypothetical protein
MGVAMTKDISIQKVRIYLLFFSLYSQIIGWRAENDVVFRNGLFYLGRWSPILII